MDKKIAPVVWNEPTEAEESERESIYQEYADVVSSSATLANGRLDGPKNSKKKKIPQEHCVSVDCNENGLLSATRLSR